MKKNITIFDDSGRDVENYASVLFREYSTEKLNGKRFFIDTRMKTKIAHRDFYEWLLNKDIKLVQPWWSNYRVVLKFKTVEAKNNFIQKCAKIDLVRELRK